jgi:hypothetical protein
MTGKGLQKTVNSWFNFKTPKSTVKKNFIDTLLKNLRQTIDLHNHSRFLWTGSGLTYKEGFIYFHDIDGAEKIKAEKSEWEFLSELTKMCNIRSNISRTTLDVEKICQIHNIDLDTWLTSDLFSTLSAYGLLIL